jgi:hypothetical protein
MARYGSLRASDADREHVVDRLRNAAAEGRLAAHELEQRVAAALRARTYGELDATVSDLPSSRRSQPRRAAVASLREHPMLLVAAIPVVLVAVALLAAITVASLALGAAVFLLTRRRMTYLGPGTYAYRRCVGPYGRAGGRARGYWA